VKRYLSVRLPLALLAAVYFAGTLLYFLVSRQMLSKYEAIEAEDVARQMERGAEAVGGRLDRLQSAASDWAVWDDTYAFIEHQSPEYLASNVQPAAFAELDIDYLMLVDRAGTVVLARAVNPVTRAEQPFPDVLRRRAAGGAPFARMAGEESRFRGLSSIGEECVLLGARPILRSDGSGPPWASWSSAAASTRGYASSLRRRCASTSRSSRTPARGCRRMSAGLSANACRRRPRSSPSTGSGSPATR
jgi:sensor domain CHASE-containing protein